MRVSVTSRGNIDTGTLVDRHLTFLFYFRRQFNSELESKLIKLIFNGQILEDDKKSLSQCGIFSEAVIHCLILQKRNVVTPVASSLAPTPRNVNNRSLLNPPNPLEWSGSLLIYILGMILVSLTLVFCWYCR